MESLGTTDYPCYAMCVLLASRIADTVSYSRTIDVGYETAKWLAFLAYAHGNPCYHTTIKLMKEIAFGGKNETCNVLEDETD